MIDCTICTHLPLFDVFICFNDVFGTTGDGDPICSICYGRSVPHLFVVKVSLGKLALFMFFYW